MAACAAAASMMDSSGFEDRSDDEDIIVANNAGSDALEYQQQQLPRDQEASGSKGPTLSGSAAAGTPSSAVVAASVATLTQPAAAASGVPSKPKKKKKERKAVVNYSLSKYPVIKELAKNFGYAVEDDEELERMEFNLLWTDTILPLQKLVKLQPWQRTNHFPSMYHLTRKVYLGLTMNRMRKVLPHHYLNVPRTWSLRSERSAFMKYLQSLGATKKVFILKPNAGCQGRGIILTKDPANAVEDLENFVAQEYVTRPLLIDKKKFDLRVYVLVTSMRYPSIHIFNDGLVRMCADDYEKPTDENMSQTSMHLTNYAVNKHSDNFVFNSDGERGDVGNKRDFKFFFNWVESQGQSSEKLWERIEHLVTKTILSAQPLVSHAYTTCFPHCTDGFTIFEVLGFDILIDEKFKPWLMEVNHTPSFSCDTPLDHRIKYGMLSEVWKIVGVSGNDKLRAAERDRINFERRMNISIQQANASAPTSASANGAGATNSGSAPSPIDPSATAPMPYPPAMESAASPSIAEIFAQEDARSTNFRRIFPCRDPEKMAVYSEIMRVAAELAIAPTTASTEIRQTEARAERERREAERQMRPPPPPPPPVPVRAKSGDYSSSSMTSAPPLKAKPRAQSFRMVGQGSSSSAAAGRPGPIPLMAPQPSSSDSPTEESSPALVSPTARTRKVGLHPPQSAPPHADPTSPCDDTPATTVGGPPPPSSRGPGSNNNTHTGTSTPQSSSAMQGTPKLRVDPERDRRRLEEQTERHRRRMLLGARMNVFQLRDAQIEALAALASEEESGNSGGGVGAGGGGVGAPLMGPGTLPQQAPQVSMGPDTGPSVLYRHIAPQLVATSSTVVGRAAGGPVTRGRVGAGAPPSSTPAAVPAPAGTSVAQIGPYHWLFQHHHQYHGSVAGEE